MRGLLLSILDSHLKYFPTFFPALRGLLFALPYLSFLMVLSSPRCGGYSAKTKADANRDITFFPALRGLLSRKLKIKLSRATFFPALRGLLLGVKFRRIDVALSSPRCGGYSLGSALRWVKVALSSPRCGGLLSYSENRNNRRHYFLPRVAGVTPEGGGFFVTYSSVFTAWRG